MAPFYPGFDHKGYNPRRGAGNTGRVRKEDFSIDGRAWDYRDPYNQVEIDRQNTNREKGRFTTNQNAYEIANPLYDYDYGRVRDAAKALGINNVNKKKEVKDILAYIQGGGSKPKDEEPQDTVQEPSEPPVFTPSEAHQEVKAEYDSTRDNPIPRMSDQPGLASSSGSSSSSDPMLDAIRHGDDLNDWYRRDTEARKAEAKLGAYEMGERTRFFANQFVGKVPELGDVGKLYANYAEKLEDMA